MARDFDPRPWNLLAGFAVATGCGSRTISADSINDGETQNTGTGPESGPESGPQYVPHHDGHIPYYDCYGDIECASLELCEAYSCHYVGTPPPCDIALVSVPPFEISEPVLNLAFVDVDDDGASELVVATQMQLHVYESGATMPNSYPRPYARTRGLEAGAFDMDPMTDLYGSPPRAQASFDVLGTPLEIASSSVAGWTLVTIYDRFSATMTTRWGMPDSEIARMRAGDLDGLDEIDEVAIIAEGNLSILVSNECLLPLTLAGPAMNLVFGDHDGDGDDELAVHTGDNQVSLIDVE